MTLGLLEREVLVKWCSGQQIFCIEKPEVLQWLIGQPQCGHEI